jgi:hypothetical protein
VNSHLLLFSKVYPAFSANLQKKIKARDSGATATKAVNLQAK